MFSYSVVQLFHYSIIPVLLAPTGHNHHPLANSSPSLTFGKLRLLGSIIPLFQYCSPPPATITIHSRTRHLRLPSANSGSSVPLFHRSIVPVKKQESDLLIPVLCIQPYLKIIRKYWQCFLLFLYQSVHDLQGRFRNIFHMSSDQDAHVPRG